VEKSAGGRIVSRQAHNGGFGRQIAMVDVETPEGERRELVLRCEQGTVFAGTEISLAREATAYRALRDRGVPIPHLYGATAARDALLLERVSGDADTASLSEEERETLAAHFAEVLASLHAIDPGALDLPGFARPATPAEHALCDLELWMDMYRAFSRGPDPLVRFAYQWLVRNAPTSVQRTVFVQGDTGPGNFLHADGRVRALIDWEFCHVGDPQRPPPRSRVSAVHRQASRGIPGRRSPPFAPGGDARPDRWAREPSAGGGIADPAGW
jgi:aminoglycoside phosphotransferase (APT) family kinase protein